MLKNDDSYWMAAVIRFSTINRGLTKENPNVGCLLVQDGVVVGAGKTAFGGRPHAEVIALQQAGYRAEGATAYVSLEPCSHYGQTPPCANALIKAKVKRVVIALLDPDQRVSGRGVAALRAAGIEVKLGVCSELAYASMSSYLTYKSLGRCEVILKMACDATNLVGCRDGKQLKLTNAITDRQVHLLRSRVDAILVGIDTVLNDNPLLNCRLPGLEARSPTRIVLDSNLRLPLDSNLVKTTQQFPLLVIGKYGACVEKRKMLEQAGVNVYLQESEGDHIQLEELLSYLATINIYCLLVEGGVKIAKSFLLANLVDTVIQIKTSGKALNADLASLPDYNVRFAELDNMLAQNFKLAKRFAYTDNEWSQWARI